MGNLVSSSMDSIVEKQKELAIKQRILDLKQQKKARDFQQAMNIALLRDRVYWMSAFYVTMGAVSLGRMLIIKQFDPLPLKTVPYVLVPFLIGYQIDFAWGTKSNRIYNEAQKILNDEKSDYWFNRPAVLPDTLKPYLHQMEQENAEKLKALGKPPEKPWAV